MESNTSLEVNDNEVPLKTDHNQSDNGPDITQPESPLNEELEPINDQKTSSDNTDSNVKSEENQDSNKDNSEGVERHQYSKEQLIQISKSFSARIRPKCLDNAFNNTTNGLWNPEKWINTRSPVANTSTKYNYNKRGNDLKDRVLEEENDIILSPQRGSFGTGCHVSSNTFAPSSTTNDSRSRDNNRDTRDHYTERNKTDESIDTSHRSNANTRRVGSGRIVAKERDRPNDWSDRNDRSYDRAYDHRDGRDGRDNRDKDNRSDGQEYNGRRFDNRDNRRSNRDMNCNRNFQRYNESQRYHRHREEDEAPEWFTDGPTSKHQTIDLKGFDDDIHNDQTEDQSKDGRNKENNESNVGNQNNSEEKDIKEVKKELKSDDFDINAMFKNDDWFVDENQTQENKMISSAVRISENNDNKSDTNLRSRSKRWFQEFKETSNSSPMTSESTDFQTNENFMKNKLKENLSPPSMTRPRNTQMSTQMSTPISSDKIFQMLSNGSNRMSIEQISHQKFDPTKAMSVAEIEANHNFSQKVDVNNGEGISDKRAFDKLIHDLNKKSAQNPSPAERAHSEGKAETNVMQTPDANIVIPKSMRIAPSILELLKEQESMEAMADLHRNNRRVVQNQVNNHPNPNPVPQNAGNNQMFGSHNLSNIGPNPNDGQNWQNSGPLKSIQSVRPSHSPSNQELSEHTAIMLQNALKTRQHHQQQQHQQQYAPQQAVRPQTDNIRVNTPNRSSSNFLIPTSVMRKMQSTETERDPIKSVHQLNDMTPDSNSSQYKFSNDNFMPRPSPMRPIVKSNNPMGQSMGQSMATKSPLSPHSESPSFGGNNMSALQSHLFHQTVPQNSSPVNSYQRSISSSNANPNIHPFNLGHNSLTRNSTPSPNAINNMAINSNQHSILQMFNNPNVRTNVNQMQMNQMMALHHNSISDGRQSQYSQSRPITAPNVQQMLFNTSKSGSDQFNLMLESDAPKTSVPTTYSQPRPQMQQMFQCAPQPNRSTESRFLGQIFGQEALHHSLPELPTVPLHNALTLDDVERP